MQNAIFNGSPRSGGNSEFASKLILESLGSATIYPIAKANIAPCIACDYCASHYGKCALSEYDDISSNTSLENAFQKDQAHYYFQKLFTANHVFFVSPIYHYSVPAQVKAFLDRSQVWFYSPQKIAETPKKCGLILLGARTKGAKLFEGASLTFKYALQSMGFSVASPLCFYGLDGKNDLEKRADYQQEIIDYAKHYLTLSIL